MVLWDSMVGFAQYRDDSKVFLSKLSTDRGAGAGNPGLKWGLK